jgi:hypothetical protein
MELACLEQVIRPPANGIQSVAKLPGCAPNSTTFHDRTVKANAMGSPNFPWSLASW